MNVFVAVYNITWGSLKYTGVSESILEYRILSLKYRVSSFFVESPVKNIGGLEYQKSRIWNEVN